MTRRVYFIVLRVLSVLCTVGGVDASASELTQTGFKLFPIRSDEIERVLQTASSEFVQTLDLSAKAPEYLYQVYEWKAGCVAQLQVVNTDEILPAATQRTTCSHDAVLEAFKALTAKVLRVHYQRRDAHSIFLHATNGDLSPDDLNWGRACSRGDLRGCIHVARAYRDGIGVAEDKEIAAQFYQYVCDEGGLSACAQQFFYGVGKPRNQQYAMRLYRAACDRGEQIGCFLFGLRLTSMAQKNAAAKQFKGACERNELGGCRQWVRLSSMLDRKSDFKLNRNEAENLLGMSCVGGYRHACIDLGRKYYRERLTPEYLNQAVDIFHLACKQSLLATGCSAAADVLSEQEGRGQQIRAFYLQGCELNEAYSCVQAARLEPDPGVAKSFREKACRLGKKEMCR